jgi:hypothetical protein
MNEREKDTTQQEALHASPQANGPRQARIWAGLMHYLAGESEHARRARSPEPEHKTEGGRSR